MLGGVTAYPFAIQVPETTSQIAVTNTSLFALDESGSVSLRELFPGANVRPEPTQVWTSAIAIAAAGNTACAIIMGGALECAVLTMGPAPLVPGGVTDVQVMPDDSLCFKAEDQLQCARSANDASLIIAGNGSAVGYARGPVYDCAFNDSGELACWSELGPKGVNDVTGLAIGAEFGCVLRSAGRVSCWGSRNNGALGDGIAGPAVEQEPVDARPAPTVSLPEVVLLRSTPLGACDSLRDVYVFGDGRHVAGNLHAALRGCRADAPATPSTFRNRITMLPALSARAVAA